MNGLEFLDQIVILIYFALAIGIGLLFSYRKDRTVRDYFLAGRNIGWFTIGITIFITNISSEHLIGLAGAGATKGLSVIQFEWLAIFAILFLGWYVAPIFLKEKILTVPQYFGQKYDGRTRTYLSAVSLFTYLFTKIGVTLLVCNYLLKSYLGFNFVEATLIIVVLTGLYTIIGGMTSVVYTQLFQAFVLLLGSFSLTYFGLKEVGGLEGLTAKLPSDYFSLVKPFSDPDLPWTGILFGAPILAIWYWCSDQYIVQRILAAKGIKDIRKGTLVTTFLKLFPILLLVIPGLVALALNPNINANEAFAFLLSGNILPVGIKGIVISGLFAALMSSLAAAFHSSATIFTLDIFSPKRPEASETKLILVGRLAITVLVIISIALIPMLRMVNSNIYIFLQNLQAFISPPIAAVFLISIFWKRATATGAFSGLVAGGIIGLARILISVIDVNGTFLMTIKNVNYLHFAAYLFAVSVTITIVVSLFTVSEKSLSESEILNKVQNPVRNNFN